MKGIDFTPDMHRAIREGRKSMTRRKLNPQPTESFGWYPNETAKKRKHYAQENHFRKGAAIDHAKYKVGDRVFVRETFMPCCDPDTLKPNGQFLYRASYTGPEPIHVDGDGFAVWNKDGSARSPWTNARFMPAHASRTILEITGVRVERVNEITNEDAIAEGVPHGSEHPMCIDDCRTAFSRFCELWESIHGPGAWARNDWVFVYEFKAVQK